MPKVVRTFLGEAQADRGVEHRAHVLEGARADRTTEGLEFRKDLFDGIEVGAVRREESERRADTFNREPDRRMFVDGQVVEDDDIAGPERRREDLIDIRAEGGLIDGAIEDSRGGEGGGAQRRDHRVGLPMPTRRVIGEAVPAGAPSIPAEQIGRDAGLIDKHEVLRVLPGPQFHPAAARRRDIRTTLLVGVYRFF